MQAMELTIPRRRFIGSAVALGAGAAIGTTMSFPAGGVPLAAAGRQDLVHEELIRQLKDGVHALRGARPGEAARGLAATLRLLAAHYQANGVDDDLKKRLRAAIARGGREAVLRWEADAAMRAAEAREFGVADIPLPREPFNAAERERALDALLTHGATPALLAAASELARLAPQLDRMPVSPVVRRQCSGATGMAYSLEFIAMASCLVNPILCAGFGGAYFGLKLSLYYFGC
jgi:hypothetical protein